MEKGRGTESFGSRVGFILATAGSAVGLGNIWRFPYLAAEYGGGIFLITYLFLAVTFGFALTLTDVAIGRRTRKSVLGAYGEVDKRFAVLGYIGILIPGVMLSYYCDIGGWVVKYMVTYVTGGGGKAAHALFTAPTGEHLSFFEHFMTDTLQATVYFMIFLGATVLVILLGVQKGIERISKVMMPVLIIMILGIAVYTLTLQGAAEGLRYYLLPDFKGFTAGRFLETVKVASGQLFYSIGIAAGTLLTYGAYMRKEDALESSVRKIESIDTGVAFLAGLIIVPSVFIFSGGDQSVLNTGPGLMFVTMPKVFDALPAGELIGLCFFILVTFAALTSSIALMEAVVYSLMEKLHIGRVRSCLITLGIMVVLGMLSVLGHSAWSDITVFGMQFMDFFDYITSSVLMPLLALFTCVLIGFVVKISYVEEEVLISENKFCMKGVYSVMVKYFCPICLILMLASLIFGI